MPDTVLGAEDVMMNNTKPSLVLKELAVRISEIDIGQLNKKKTFSIFLLTS